MFYITGILKCFTPHEDAERTGACTAPSLFNDIDSRYLARACPPPRRDGKSRALSISRARDRSPLPHSHPWRIHHARFALISARRPDIISERGNFWRTRHPSRAHARREMDDAES
jgi:hypothetical protein